MTDLERIRAVKARLKLENKWNSPGEPTTLGEEIEEAEAMEMAFVEITSLRAELKRVRGGLESIYLYARDSLDELACIDPVSRDNEEHLTRASDLLNRTLDITDPGRAAAPQPETED